MLVIVSNGFMLLSERSFSINFCERCSHFVKKLMFSNVKSDILMLIFSLFPSLSPSILNKKILVGIRATSMLENHYINEKNPCL